jgi:lipoyl(octanoyl) transferase
LPEPSGKLQVCRLGTVEYTAALDLQERLVGLRQSDQIGDAMLLLEHPNVYTLGRGASESFLIDRTNEIEVLRVSRGGEVTFHGPGQLVGYPILKLIGSERDVHDYLRRLEQTMIDALATLAIAARRRSGLTGVWIEDRKLASIGVGIKRWVTLHGFAINVRTDLGFFDRIVPCGIAGCKMTSIAREGRHEVTVDRLADAITGCFARVFRREALTGTASQLFPTNPDDSRPATRAMSLS